MFSTNYLLFIFYFTYPNNFLATYGMISLLILYNLKSYKQMFKFHMIDRLFQSCILHLIIQVSVNDATEIQEMYNQWVRHVLF